MNRKLRHAWTALLAVSMVVSASLLVARPGETPVAEQVAATGGDKILASTLAEVEAALAAIEANSAIDDAVKDLLRPKYKQAID